MIDYLAAEDVRLYALVAGGVVLLLFLWVIWRRRRGRAPTVGEVVRRISFDYLSHIILPNADEGEIHLDHLLLTAEGLLIIDVKNVEGIVFGSDKMQEWTVIGRDRRYTFSNPQPGMFDRIAAVRQVVRDVPVTGRILFLDGADFKKGVPDLVCSLDELLDEFGEASDQAANAKIDAFKPHWERIRERARPAEARRSRRRAVAV
ncbi:MAG: nuclease-related domain-containing protein [Woeseiaceae bacterium]|nr:nuclease-related domain-containing protein [Woeseiaceae bacterium]